jgi:glutathione S-transferase
VGHNPAEPYDELRFCISFIKNLEILMSPWVSLVTILALVLFLVVTINVGRARIKYGVKAPAVSGNIDFERVLRVQQNTLEQLILFLPALWIFATFVSPIAAAILGTIWIAGRILYAWGYYQAAEKRGSGFAVSTVSTMVLLVGSLVGIGWQLLKS